MVGEKRQSGERLHGALEYSVRWENLICEAQRGFCEAERALVYFMHEVGPVTVVEEADVYGECLFRVYSGWTVNVDVAWSDLSNRTSSAWRNAVGRFVRGRDDA